MSRESSLCPCCGSTIWCVDGAGEHSPRTHRRWEVNRCPECRHAGGLHDAACQSGRELTTSPQPAPEPQIPAGWLRDQGWAVDGEGEDLWFHSVDSKARGMHLRWLRALLATQGLHVVGAKEMAVLEATRTSEIEIVGGVNRLRKRFMFELQEHAVCEAELARREPK